MTHRVPDAYVEMRSDTFSLPSVAMYDALRSAPLGDDVYGEDPTVALLERRAAELTGKERGLLVTSGSQANLTAVLSQTSPGDEVLIGATSDCYNHETSAITRVAGILPRPLDDADGSIRRAAVRAAMRTPDIHNGTTTLLMLENSHQASGGTPLPADAVAELAEEARAAGARVHVDGARLMNAAVALDVPPRTLCEPIDTVSFCLSKGLSCPIGSMLCGDEATIERARKARKMLGGGIRQGGWIAAAGLVALDDLGRLAEDHALARRLAANIADIPGVMLDSDRVRTNIVSFDLAEDAGIDAEDLVAGMWSLGVRALVMGERRVRMVIHRGIGSSDVERAAEALSEVISMDPASRTRSATPVDLSHN